VKLVHSAVHITVILSLGCSSHLFDVMVTVIHRYILVSLKHWELTLYLYRNLSVKSIV